MTQSCKQHAESTLQNQNAGVMSTRPNAPLRPKASLQNQNAGAIATGSSAQTNDASKQPDQIKVPKEHAEQNRLDYLQSQSKVAELIDLVNLLTQQVHNIKPL